MKIPFKITSILLMLFLILSCTKDIDIDQLDDVEISPTYLITLAYFELHAPDFLDSINTEVPIQVDVVQASMSDIPQEYLEKVEFTIETTNIFNRDFNAKIVFFDANQKPIYELAPILIPANSIELETIIEIPAEDIHFIFDTEYFAFFLQLLPSDDGSTISPDDDSYVEFKSSVQIFLKYSDI